MKGGRSPHASLAKKMITHDDTSGGGTSPLASHAGKVNVKAGASSSLLRPAVGEDEEINTESTEDVKFSPEAATAPVAQKQCNENDKKGQSRAGDELSWTL